MQTDLEDSNESFSLPESAVTVTIPQDADGERADKALAGLFPEWSRERLQGCFSAGQVWLNGRPIPKRSRLSAGALVTLVLPEPVPSQLEPVAMPLDVLYEDAWVLVINKASGVVVHPGAGVCEPTLCHGLLHYTGGKLASAGGEQRPGVVHRLDRDTSGAIVFAKTDAAYFALVRAFSARDTLKEYRCITRGTPVQDEGTIDKPIDRHPVNRVKMTARAQGKPARTDWHVLERFRADSFAYLHCRIHTGRTHQIRVHLSEMGCPIWGDTVYGCKKGKQETDFPGRFLRHAWPLVFPHPQENRVVDVEAPLPLEFTSRLERLREA